MRSEAQRESRISGRREFDEQRFRELIRERNSDDPQRDWPEVTDGVLDASPIEFTTVRGVNGDVRVEDWRVIFPGEGVDQAGEMGFVRLCGDEPVGEERSVRFGRHSLGDARGCKGRAVMSGRIVELSEYPVGQLKPADDGFQHPRANIASFVECHGKRLASPINVGVVNHAFRSLATIRMKLKPLVMRSEYSENVFRLFGSRHPLAPEPLKTHDALWRAYGLRSR